MCRESFLNPVGRALLTQGDENQEEALVLTFALALVLLRRDECQPAFFSSKNLESRDKKLGWMQMSFLKYSMVRNLLGYVSHCDEKTHKNLVGGLKLLESPLAFHENFPSAMPNGSDDGEQVVDVEEKTSEEVKKTMGKMNPDQKRYFNLVRDIYDGEYDEEIRSISVVKNFKILADLTNPTSDRKNYALCLGWSQVLAMIDHDILWCAAYRIV